MSSIERQFADYPFFQHEIDQFGKLPEYTSTFYTFFFFESIKSIRRRRPGTECDKDGERARCRRQLLFLFLYLSGSEKIEREGEISARRAVERLCSLSRISVGLLGKRLLLVVNQKKNIT